MGVAPTTFLENDARADGRMKSIGYRNSSIGSRNSFVPGRRKSRRTGTRVRARGGASQRAICHRKTLKVSYLSGVAPILSRPGGLRSLPPTFSLLFLLLLLLLLPLAGFLLLPLALPLALASRLLVPRGFPSRALDRFGSPSKQVHHAASSSRSPEIRVQPRRRHLSPDEILRCRLLEKSRLRHRVMHRVPLHVPHHHQRARPRKIAHGLHQLAPLDRIVPVHHVAREEKIGGCIETDRGEWVVPAPHELLHPRDALRRVRRHVPRQKLEDIVVACESHGSIDLGTKVSARAATRMDRDRDDGRRANRKTT